MSDIRTSITLVDNFSATAKGMAAAMTATVGECEKMKKSMGSAPDMSGYRNVQQQFIALSDAEKQAAGSAEEFSASQSAVANALTEQADKLRRAAQAAQVNADAEAKAVTVYEQEYIAYEKNANELGVLTEAQKKSIDRYKQAYEEKKKAAESAQNLADKLKTESEMADKAAQSARKEADAYGELNDTAQKMGGSLGIAADSMSNLMMAAGGYKMMQFVKSAFEETTSAAIEYESAMTGVFKTVDGTREQLQQLGSDVRSMALDMPSNTTEIAGVMEAAGQLGIATEDVSNFSKVMIDLGQATNLTADDAASALAKFANITGMSADKYSNLGSTIVDLGNNFATTEADIVNMSTYLTSSASVAGLAETDILALSTAMISLGINAEAGGSSMSKLISTMQTAVETGGDDLTAFAEVANMTADQFKTAFGENAVGALQAFIGGLNDVERNGKSISVILKDMDLDDIRMSNMLKALAQGSDVLTSAVSKANTAWEENIALTNEVEKRYATLESKTQMMKNAANDLQISVGNTLTPAMGLATDAATGLLKGLTSVSDACPELSGGIMGAVGAVGGLGSAAITILPVIAQLSQAMAGLKASGLLSGALSGLSLGKVGLAIGGIAAVGALIGGLSGYFSKAKDEVEDYNGTLEECAREIENVRAAHESAAELYGEESDAARRLGEDLDTLNAQYEKGGGAAEDYAKRAEEGFKAASEAHKKYSDGLKSVDDTATSGLIMAAQLEALGKKANKTNDDFETMSNLVEQIEGTYDLNLNINYDTGEVEGLERIKEITDDYIKTAQKEKAEEYASGSDNLVGLREKYEERANNARQMKALEEELARVANAPGHVNGENPAEQGKNYTKLKEDLDKFTNDWKKSDDAVKQFERDFTDAYTKMGYTADQISDQLNIIETGTVSGVEDSFQRYSNIQDILNAFYSADRTPGGANSDYLQNLIDQMNGLTSSAVTSGLQSVSEELMNTAAKYDEVYQAAYDSFSKQYGLFDDASASYKKTVEDIKKSNSDIIQSYIDTTDSQTEYFNTLNDSIETLSSTAAKDIGVSKQEWDGFLDYAEQLPATAGEKGAAIVNAFADAINNKDYDSIKKAVESWQSNETAMRDTSKGIGEEVAEVEDAMKKAQKAVEDSLIAIGETAPDAHTKAKNVVDQLAAGVSAGYANLSTQVSAVESLMLRLSSFNVSASIPKTTTSGGAGGGKTSSTTVSIPKDHQQAGGTRSALPGLTLVGEEGPELLMMQGGERVFNADETRRIMENGMNTEVYIPKSAQEAISMKEPEHDSSWSVGSKATQEKTISININGGDTIRVQGSISRDDVYKILESNIKPVLMNALSAEIFEEGDGSYEY